LSHIYVPKENCRIAEDISVMVQPGSFTLLGNPQNMENISHFFPTKKPDFV
jgi:hypothetical protein